jgi:hypothetical protein
MQDLPLLEGGAQRPVQSVLEIELAAPPDDVGEQVAVERRVVVQQGVEAQGVLGGDQLGQPNLSGREGSPLTGAQLVGWVRTIVPYPLEDHARSLLRAPVRSPVYAAPMTESALAAAVAAGYQFDGAALELGGLMLDATELSDVHIKIPLGMLNRHGLVAGATGTGKTKTLQLLAEQMFYLESRGIPEIEAEKLIVGGFFEPVIAEMPLESVRQRLRDIIQEKVGLPRLGQEAQRPGQ